MTPYSGKIFIFSTLEGIQSKIPDTTLLNVYILLLNGLISFDLIFYSL